MLSDTGKFLVLHGIDENVVQAAETMGVGIVLTTYSFKFTFDGTVVAKATSPAGSFKKYPGLIKANEELIVTALKKAAAVAMESADGDLQGSTPPAAPKVNPPFKAAQKQTGDVAGEAPEQFPVDQLATAPLVDLLQAEKIFQPVASSGAGSRYFLMARTEDLKVAARLTGKKLSVRVAGKTWSKVKKTVEKSKAFSHSYASVKTGYASMHCTVGDVEVASMTLAAVLASLSSAWDAHSTDVGVIAPHGK